MKYTLSMRVNDDLLRRIDAQRRSMPVGTYLRDLVERALDALEATDQRGVASLRR
ncbi:MAG TPA: hypothetical protein PKC49_11305 [Phycisphaerae bacterium]|nr:hypothetical protein [Phycisphaerae bacterium]